MQKFCFSKFVELRKNILIKIVYMFNHFSAIFDFRFNCFNSWTWTLDIKQKFECKNAEKLIETIRRVSHHCIHDDAIQKLQTILIIVLLIVVGVFFKKSY